MADYRDYWVIAVIGLPWLLSDHRDWYHYYCVVLVTNSPWVLRSHVMPMRHNRTALHVVGILISCAVIVVSCWVAARVILLRIIIWLYSHTPVFVYAEIIFSIEKAWFHADQKTFQNNLFNIDTRPRLLNSRLLSLLV